MTASGGKGAVAAGHPLTAEAAAGILREGGNAFDAALAAMAMACVAEPVLASLGGGGFMVALPAGGSPVACDFFARTPRRKRPVEEIDFHPAIADFGTTRQEFHIGMGATATPGAVAGMFAIHADHGRMPIRDTLAPAITAAREGVPMNRFQSLVMDVVAPIYRATPDSRRLFSGTDPRTGLKRAGDRHSNPDLADLLDNLAREGSDLFYLGGVAQQIARLCRDRGGHLSSEDLAGYRVGIKAPLMREHRGWKLAINPAPSTGGLLVAFGLALLDRLEGTVNSSPERLRLLAGVMAETESVKAAGRTDEKGLLDSASLDAATRSVAAHCHCSRGTTHISTVDDQGNAVALTLSNGEGNGIILPGTGTMLNNVLGEEDINPGGFHQWEPDRPMGSMMAPGLLIGPDGQRLAFGSGGSSRIRTALLQVICRITDGQVNLKDAVEAPRLHVENGRLDIEPGFPEADIAALRDFGTALHEWPESSLFFGGTQVAGITAAGFEAAADPRRDGGSRLV